MVSHCIVTYTHRIGTHRAVAVVTHVIASNEQSDNFPVFLEINVLCKRTEGENMFTYKLVYYINLCVVGKQNVD